MTALPQASSVQVQERDGVLVEIKPPRAADRASEGFYWAVTHDEQAVFAAKRLARAVGGARLLSPRDIAPIAFAIEGDLPLACDQLNAVGAVVGDAVVVCAAERSALLSVSVTTLVHSPASLPNFVKSLPGWQGLQSSHFNLLQGEFEPKPLRQHRSRLVATATAAACAALLLISLGLWRRSVHWEDAAEMYRQSAVAAARGLYPDGTGDVPAAIDRAEREVADAQAVFEFANQGAPVDHARPDCAVTLAEFLTRWPSTVGGEGESFQTELVSLTDATIAASVLTSADTGPFLNALLAPEGWKLEQPRLSQTPAGVRLGVHMSRLAPVREGSR